MTCSSCRKAEPPPGYKCCAPCIERQKAYNAKNKQRMYTPIDEYLDRLTTRILRGIRRFGSVTKQDLALALDIPDYDGFRTPEMVSFKSVLQSLRRRGRVGFSGGYWRLMPGVSDELDRATRVTVEPGVIT